MNKFKKQAFSLIEVMIIFTIMALIMAASMPMITGRSRTPDNSAKAVHGAYKCLPTTVNGVAGFNSQLFELRRNGLGRELVEKGGAVFNQNHCTFSQIPKNAKSFTIDIYSAGAGGTQYAEIKNEPAEETVEYISLSNIPAIIGEVGLQGEVKDPKHGLTVQEIQVMFQGKTVRKSIKVGDGGDGGTAMFEYKTPADAVCKAAYDVDARNNKSPNADFADSSSPTYKDLLNLIGDYDGNIIPSITDGGKKYNLPSYPELQTQLELVRVSNSDEVQKEINTLKDIAGKLKTKIEDEFAKSYSDASVGFDLDSTLSAAEETIKSAVSDSNAVFESILTKLYTVDTITGRTVYRDAAKRPSGDIELGYFNVKKCFQNIIMKQVHILVIKSQYPV